MSWSRAEPIKYPKIHFSPVSAGMNSVYFGIEPDVSFIALVDEAGQFAATYRYDAWGQVLQSNGIHAQDNTYLYTGREYDWDTGIYYYRARSYHTELGRFMQRDPAEMTDGPDMYEYVGNEPVNRVDPYGNIGVGGVHCWYECGIYTVSCDKAKFIGCMAGFGNAETWYWDMLEWISFIGLTIGCIESIAAGQITLSLVFCIADVALVTYQTAEEAAFCAGRFCSGRCWYPIKRCVWLPNPPPTPIRIDNVMTR